MSVFKDLRCFQHCQKGVDLICFALPAYCPLCGQCTATTECRIPPYVLPSPIVSSQKASRAIVLKPTDGDFINNYERACDLHIGVTDSHGVVYDFDEKGLKSGSIWPHCLTVSNLGMPQEWDEALHYICSLQQLWTPQRYNENGWNCFDFVLYFMGLLKNANRMSRDEFCNRFLVDKTKRAEQYIHLYRQALATGCVAVPKSM